MLIKYKLLELMREQPEGGPGGWSVCLRQSSNVVLRLLRLLETEGLVACEKRVRRYIGKDFRGKDMVRTVEEDHWVTVGDTKIIFESAKPGAVLRQISSDLPRVHGDFAILALGARYRGSVEVLVCVHAADAEGVGANSAIAPQAPAVSGIPLYIDLFGVMSIGPSDAISPLRRICAFCVARVEVLDPAEKERLLKSSARKEG